MPLGTLFDQAPFLFAGSFIYSERLSWYLLGGAKKHIKKKHIRIKGPPA